MIGKWFKDRTLGMKLPELGRVKGGIVQVISIDPAAHVFDNTQVKDFRTGDIYLFNEYIMQFHYKEVTEAEVVLYANR
jgi:hypothetical protein